MTIDERLEFVRARFKDIEGLLSNKGRDYGAEYDANQNFHEAADELGDKFSEYDVWMVYFNKHMRAIKRFIREGFVESEPIDARIGDAITYLFILWSMHESEKCCNGLGNSRTTIDAVEEINEPISLSGGM